MPAGNEVFASDLVVRYVGELAESAGISHERLLELGRSPETDGFGLTPLALRLSSHANGVSELHGEVAREMWAGLWPGEQPPIDAITNGVHLGTWLAPELTRCSARPVSGRRLRRIGRTGPRRASSTPTRSGARTASLGAGSPSTPASTPSG